jgi:predicted acetyltransferase
MELAWPSLDRLDGFADALRRGWSPDTVRGAAAAHAMLERIALDAQAFVEALVDRQAKGAPVELPDGTLARRLPGYQRWIWDGEFCGTIGFRWQPGSCELPPHVLGHIGYAVVPWKRGRGHATRALQLQLPDCAREGLSHVILTTDPDNVASCRVIERCGGRVVERFVKPAAFGGGPGVRYRIELASPHPAPAGGNA